jgi:hypothetical protein
MSRGPGMTAAPARPAAAPATFGSAVKRPPSAPRPSPIAHLGVMGFADGGKVFARMPNGKAC